MKRALISGSNRGLGFETAKQLIQHGWEVVVGARDRASGEAAVKQLGDAAKFLSLDIGDEKSVRAAAESVGAIDALVNNAAIAMSGTGAKVAKPTIDVNYFGTARMCDHFLPLIRRPGSLVVVSSGLGELAAMPPTIRRRFEDPSLDRAGLDALMRELSSSPSLPSAYAVSKCAVNALVRVLAKDHTGVAINSVCPGWVRTRMGGNSAERDVDEGADTIVWAAMLSGSPSGKWFRDRAEIEW